MDYESLGEEIISESVEDSEMYVKFSEKDEIRRIDSNDFEKAKGFLSTVSSKSNISLYDHIADVLQTILRSKVRNAVDKFEDLSLRLKKLRQTPESGLTEAFQIREELQDFLKEKQIFYKFPASAPDMSQTIRTTEEEGEDSDEEDEKEAEAVVSEEAAAVDEAPDLTEALPDINYIMGRFRQAGIGLSEETVYELSIALKDLVLQHKLRKVRFWGKVLGIKDDYYVAEAPYQEGIVQENFGWEAEKEKEADVPVEEEEVEEKVDEEDEDLVEEGNEEEEPEEGGEKADEEPEAPKIPPLPEMKPKIKKKIPPEANGTGINEYMYFVCSKIGQPWRVLPFLTPLQVTEARQIKRFFTGDLESQIRGCMPYPGKEAHYLRAQIARISASTYIAPADYYKKTDEDEEDEEEDGDGEFVVNPEFSPRPATHLYSDGLNGWIHYRRAVLHQGRCIPMKLEKDDDEEEQEQDDEDKDEEEKEEEPEILEAIVEIEVPLLRSISEDRAIGRLKPWSMKLSSKLIEETAVLIVYSSLWPGAYTFYDGKTFDHIYIGYGYKYSVFHYAPPIRVSWHAEYAVGDDVIEHVDQEILPPEPEEADEDENADEETDENADKDEEDEEDDEKSDED